MATIGKNILENLTSGMYHDSRVIYREYIQNSCDQIDKAVVQELIAIEDALIDIYFDEKKRYISIRDNATGVSADNFESELGDIANSNKIVGEDKGFRGIGRLCGLAYCKTLRFTTSFKGEHTASIMICNAVKMRKMLMENVKYTVDEILSEIVELSSKPEDENAHYFEVELIDINKENTDLLDEKKVIEYLSFVAPTPYKNTFSTLRNSIYNYAKKLEYHIDEYPIKVNGQQIFKEYKTSLYEKGETNLKRYDQISSIEFKEFRNPDGTLLAWMWIGLSRFEKSIPRTNIMRGLRLRMGNIQLGNDDCLQGLFKEGRGNYYFVGEVFAVDKTLIPNSQRNYFNENETRVRFETLLRNYFYEVLHKLYNDANRLKLAYRRQEEYIDKINEFDEKSKNMTFIDDVAKQQMQYEIEKAKKSAEDAVKQLAKMDNIPNDSPIVEVYKNIRSQFNADDLKIKVEKTLPSTFENESAQKKTGYLSSSLSKLNKNERKLVGRIYSIISETTDKAMADRIINRIQEELK